MSVHTRRWLRHGAAVAGLILLAGCTSRVYVRLAPPPARVEVMSPRPGEIYVWVQGFWTWSDYAYVWSPGRWVRAPHAPAVWIPGEWRKNRRGYYWVPGHWHETR